MTAPINPTVIKQEGLGETAQRVFQPMVQAIAMNRQFKQREKEFQLQQQQFQLEQFKTRKSADMTDQQIAESRARVENLKLENQQAQRDFTGEQAGQQAVNLLAAEADTINAEFGTPEWLELVRNARASLANLGDDADPGAAHAHLDAYLDQVREDATGAANIAASEAAQALNMQNAALARDNAQLARGQAILGGMVASGLTAGESAGIQGLQLPAGVDPDTKALITRGGAGGGAAAMGGQEAAVAASRFDLMSFSDKVINSKIMTEGGLRVSGEVLRLMSRTSLRGPTNWVVSNIGGGEEQQALVTAILNFADMWRNHISGQAATDKEYNTIVAYAVPSFGDGEEVIEMKRLMRQIMLDAVQTAARGFGTSRAESARGVLQRMNEQGINLPDKEITYVDENGTQVTEKIGLRAFLEQEIAVAQEFDRQAGRGLTEIDPDAPLEEQVTSWNEQIDALDFSNMPSLGIFGGTRRP